MKNKRICFILHTPFIIFATNTKANDGYFQPPDPLHYVPPLLYFALQNTGEEAKPGDTLLCLHKDS